MINIIVFCNPNYSNKQIINTIKRNIDVVSQFKILHDSIKKNWRSFEYNISLIHNKEIKFSDEDLNKLSKCKIDIYDCEPDNINLPYYCRCACLEHKLKTIGTHRLILDCDMIALSEPKFNLECDWQAMFGGSISIEKKYYDYINQHYKYNIDLENKENNMHVKYNNGLYKNFKDLFPHFNGGAILIKEELCEKFSKLWKPSIELSLNNEMPHDVRHIALQYSMSFALVKLSENWKPFEPGFNYILKLSNKLSLDKNKITLLHYCGENGYELALNEYKSYFI